MKFLDIDGKPVSVDVKQSSHPLRAEAVSKSNIQHKVGQWLVGMFNGVPVLEEFVIPGSMLRLDFFIPKRRLAVEVQGEQHTEHIGFYHGHRNKMALVKQKKRDSDKLDWCILNNINIIYVTKETTYDEFKSRIRESENKRRGMAGETEGRD